ncbi:MAG TPA: class I SAM-dependent methyltransferase [Patescibacteria group bacterium]|nr:class I SAM-dependent methyltransferase [Patescibacteria group bacterium]
MKYHNTVNMTTDNSASLILRRIVPGSRVLELGAATGYMTQYMAEQLGCRVWAVEIDPEAAELASVYAERMQVADLNGTGWLQDLETNSFDHIILVDVLEHLREPDQVLQRVRPFLKPTGTLLTSIPNIAHNAVIMSLLRDEFPYRELGLLDNSHIRFFTGTGIGQLLISAGLLPVEWDVTVAVPAATEFQRTYDEFPPAVAEFLEDRPNGHVYQYITVSRRADNEPELLPVPPPEIIAEYVAGGIQLFWMTETGFCEDSSRRLPLWAGEPSRQYQVLLPRQSSGPIRLDPGCHPACLRLEQLSVSSEGPAGEKELFRCSGADGYQGLVAAHQVVPLIKDGAYRCVCTGDDPQILIEHPALEDYSGPVRLRFSLWWERLPVSAVSWFCRLEEESCVAREEWIQEELQQKLRTIQRLEEQIAVMSQSCAARLGKGVDRLQNIFRTK